MFGLFPVFVVVNNAAVNIHVQVFVWDIYFQFPRESFRVELLDNMVGVLCLTF